MTTRPIVQLTDRIIKEETRPVVLGVLQNEWVYDPPRLQKAISLSKDPEKFRRKMIAYALFAGCKTGRMLMSCLGDAWCNKIIWENASRRIGDVSSSVFSADIGHMGALVYEIQPDIIIAFGKVAHEGFMELLGGVPSTGYFNAPHPCARSGEVAQELRSLKTKLDVFKNEYTPKQQSRTAIESGCKR